LKRCKQPLETCVGKPTDVPSGELCIPRGIAMDVIT